MNEEQIPKQPKNNTNKTYIIRSKQNQHYIIDICGGGRYLRSPIVIMNENNFEDNEIEEKQSWIWIFKDGMIINQKTKHVLTASNEDDPSRMEIIQDQQTGELNQIWEIETMNKKNKSIIWNKEYPDLCMTIENDEYSDDTCLLLLPFNSSSSQYFIIDEN